MEANDNNIIQELKEVSPLVAEIGKQNLYFLPEGYFDYLSESMLSCIRLEQVKTRNPYFVPAGYFDSLALSIIAQIKLKQIKFEANPYSIPAGYFENLAGAVLNKIHSASSNNEVYEELSEVAPLLNSIDKSNVYSVPQGYFEKLSAPVNREKKAAKVVSIGSNIRRWVTYAAAASVLFIVATTTYLFVDIHEPEFEKHLPVEQRISELDDQEIMNYLKDNDGITSGSFISVPDEQDSQIQNLLKNASDEDIQNYLDESSDADEPATGI